MLTRTAASSRFNGGRTKDDGLVFDELGVDQLFIDEAQYYKNLETPTKMERVAGVQTGGSERAFDLYMKDCYLEGQHPGHGLVFATGTPISNTMVEMYTMQRYLDPEGLRSRGLEHFDAWAASFGEVIDTVEISPDGASFRPRSRFARFTNLPELQQMFRSFSDFQTAERWGYPGRPFRAESPPPLPVPCPRSSTPSSLSLSNATSGSDPRRLTRGRITRFRSPRTAESSPSTLGCFPRGPRIFQAPR